MSAPDRLILTFACLDATGLVADVSGLIADCGGWIVASDNYADQDSGMFFMRQEILTDSLTVTREVFAERVESLANAHDMSWKLRSRSERYRIAVLVTRAEHCLYDLLGRSVSGDLEGDLTCVIANRPDLQQVTEAHGIPFYNFGDADGRVDFAELANPLHDHEIDTVVLARFMQIMPRSLCETYSGRMLNIHHSFLPSFKGARPYAQAHERGVKLVGATCHYVTPDLDEGPIIEQDVVRITHADDVPSLQRAGKDVEKAVLSRGLQAHLEDRVFLNGHRTVVLS